MVDVLVFDLLPREFTIEVREMIWSLNSFLLVSFFFVSAL